MKKLGKIERLILGILEQYGRGERCWLNEDTLYFTVARAQFNWKDIPPSTIQRFTASLKRLEEKGLIAMSMSGEERRVELVIESEESPFLPKSQRIKRTGKPLKTAVIDGLQVQHFSNWEQNKKVEGLSEF